MNQGTDINQEVVDTWIFVDSSTVSGINIEIEKQARCGVKIEIGKKQDDLLSHRVQCWLVNSDLFKSICSLTKS